MTTLIGDKLFGYLSTLEQQLKSTEETSSNSECEDEKSHYYLRRAIESEKVFLQQYHSSGRDASLAFSANGLPSVDSLVPDLEKICELASENSLFKEISSLFRKNIEDAKSEMYEEITDKEYSERMKIIKSKNTIEKEFFSIKETEDRTLKLLSREETYIDSPDEYSQTTPAIIQENTTNYKVIFGELMSHSDKRFFSVKKQALSSYNPNLPSQKRVDLEVMASMADKSWRMTKKVAKKTAKGIFYINFAIPSLIRKWISYEGGDMDNAVRVALSIIGGVANFYLEVGVYSAINKSPPTTLLLTYLTTLLAMNSASGLYEWYRYEKNKKSKEKPQNELK